MFGVGMQELLLILVVALIVLGPKRLPGMAKSLGRGLAELRRALDGVKEDFSAPLREAERTVSRLATPSPPPSPSAEAEKLGKPDEPENQG
ncbi:MAG: Sec-independent protein translocase protein TatB [Vicinamibacteria bacterium]